jgi:hypothetical protein
MILSAAQQKILIHFEGNLPQNRRVKFRRIVEQRLSGNPTTAAFEQCCSMVMAEMARGEHHAVLSGGRRSPPT